MEEVILESFHVQVCLELSRRELATLHEPRLSKMVQNLAKDAVDKLYQYVMIDLPAERLDEKEVTLTVSVPKSWWEHFKKDCFPDWLLRTWPAKFKTVSVKDTVRFLAVYPKLANCPRFQPCVVRYVTQVHEETQEDESQDDSARPPAERR